MPPAYTVGRGTMEARARALWASSLPNTKTWIPHLEVFFPRQAFPGGHSYFETCVN